MVLSASVGFIGTGGISSFIARGLLGSPDFTGDIFVTVHKNRAKAEALKALSPERVTICESNQAAADASDILFIAVLPQQHEEVVKNIKFSARNHIIHITGGAKLEKSMPLYADAASAVRSIPLPFAARRKGPVLYYGTDPLSRSLLEMLGSVVEVRDERDFEILGPITGMMVPYYALLAQYVKWGEQRGLDFRTALDYAGYMNEALSDFMRTDCTEDIEHFLTENSTPGGVNELGLRLLREENAYEPWSRTLDALYERYNSMASSRTGK